MKDAFIDFLSAVILLLLFIGACMWIAGDSGKIREQQKHDCLAQGGSYVISNRSVSYDSCMVAK